MRPSTPEIEIVKDAEALADRAAELFVSLAVESIAAQGWFSVALSGGSTPLKLYSRLRRPPYSIQIDWSKVHLFWGDERCVSPDHPDSNFNTAKLALIDHMPVPVTNIHRIQAELEPTQAALSYERELKDFFVGESLPRFDLILLGLGEDGHTASLFPGSPALSEQVHWVVSVEHQQPPPPLVSRITLTLPVLNACRSAVFLVSGAGKASRLAQVLLGPHQPEKLPSQAVQPRDGLLIWLVDQPAAGEMNYNSARREL